MDDPASGLPGQTGGRGSYGQEARDQINYDGPELAAVRERRQAGFRRGSNQPSNARCQNCLQKGHWTYQCKNSAVYAKRISRTKILKRPDLYRHAPKEEKPPEILELEEELATIEKQKKVMEKLMESDASSSSSSSSSSDSDSDSDSDSSSSSSSSSSSGSSSRSKPTHSKPISRSRSDHETHENRHSRIDNQIHPDRQRLRRS
jgi:hypothetical protein